MASENSNIPVPPPPIALIETSDSSAEQNEQKEKVNESVVMTALVENSPTLFLTNFIKFFNVVSCF
jgi:hypothetical protein